MSQRIQLILKHVTLATALAAGPLLQSARAAPVPFEVAVTAFIDGRDFFVLQDSQVFWRHFDFAAPGRWRSNNFPTYITYSLDGVQVLNEYAWTPGWSTPPPDEVRRSEDSSRFTLEGLPSLELADDIDLFAANGRGSVRVVERPNAGNDYRLSIQLDDNGPGGAAWYTVAFRGRVDQPDPPPPTTGVPEPTSLALTGLSLLALSGALRRRHRRP